MPERPDSHQPSQGVFQCRLTCASSAGYVGTKVGHRQAPQKTTPGGLSLGGLFFLGYPAVTCVGTTTSGHKPAVGWTLTCLQVTWPPKHAFRLPPIKRCNARAHPFQTPPQGVFQCRLTCASSAGYVGTKVGHRQEIRSKNSFQ